eukprot:5532640-Heterocapsa_arctica.AAC.1
MDTFAYHYTKEEFSAGFTKTEYQRMEKVSKDVSDEPDEVADALGALGVLGQCDPVYAMDDRHVSPGGCDAERVREDLRRGGRAVSARDASLLHGRLL